jgi:restriction system protein
MDRLIDVLEQSLPLFFIVGVILIIYALYQRRQRSKLNRSGVERLDSMDDMEFVRFLEELFDSVGYTVERSEPAGPGSAVLILRRAGERTAVYGVRTTRQIGLREVQEVMTAKSTFDCGRGIVVTSSTFNYPAQAVARREAIELWDRKALAERMIRRY